MIPVMVPRVEFKIDGLDGLEQAFAERIQAQMPRPMTFEVRTGGARGAAKNGLIARVQAGMQRSPFYLNAKARADIILAVRDLASSDFSRRRGAEERIKDLLLVSIGENFQAQRNSDGSRFRPLTPDYAAAKRRLLGYVAPILKRAGDFMGGLKVVIVRK